MASLKTQTRAAQFNSMRQTEGITGELALYAVSATGYSLLALISDGWFAQKETDRVDGTQFLAVRIAETDANLALLTESVVRTVASVGIGSRRYKNNSKVDPLEDPRLWLLKCEPTGEVVS